MSAIRNRIAEVLDIKELQKILYNYWEGSFGNQKQHYGVGRIATRNSRSETLLLFFAILAARQLTKEEKEKQEKRRQKVRA